MRTVKELKEFLEHFDDTDQVEAWCPAHEKENYAEGIIVSSCRPLPDGVNDIGFFDNNHQDHDKKPVAE